MRLFYRHILVCILWCGALVLPEFSHAQQYAFRNYNMKDGLAQSNVRAITQDADGYMWFATQHGGVCRFDGHTFIRYNKRDGMAKEFIQDILQDRSGNVWMATNGGVILYDGDTFINFITEADSQFSTIFSIAEDIDGNLWFGGEGGIYRIDRTLQPVKTTQHILLRRNFEIYKLYFDAFNTLWVGTEEGIYQFNAGNFVKYETDTSLDHQAIFAMVMDQAGRMWFGSTEGELWVFGNDTRRQLMGPGGSLSHYPVQVLLEDAERNVWVGTRGGGVFRYYKDELTRYTQDNGLADNSITAIFQDSEHNLWFGTESGGVDLLCDAHILSITSKEGLVQSAVTALTECPDGVIWIGTLGGGLARHDGQSTRLLTTRDRLPSNVIQALRRDKRGNLWIGTADKGLCRYDGRTYYTYTTRDGLPSNEILCIFEDHTGLIWIGTRGGGLSCFDGTSFENFSTDEGLAYRDVSAIQEDRRGILWLATPGGVSRFDAPQHRSDGLPGGMDRSLKSIIQNYQNTNGLPDNWVNSVYVDRDDVVWVLTAMGFCWIIKDEVIQADPVLQSIEHPYFIIQDGPLFYIGSGKGVHRYEKSEGLIGSIDQSNGLASNQCSFDAVYRDSRRNLWFGTGGGATRYTPVFSMHDTIQAPLYITGVSVKNEPVDMTTDLKLSYVSNKISFLFNALWFQEPDNVFYRYRLLGLEDAWFEQYGRSVEFSYLPPGAYTFQVSARNTHGIWNPEPATVSFVIYPPFWRTWWFFLSSLILLMLLLFTAHRIRTNMYRQRARVLESAVQTRTSELVHKTDELQQAKGLLEDARNNLEGIVTERTEELRETINRLNSEMAVRVQAERRLQSLASQLTLVEERQRRTIAIELHDRIGQNLSSIKRSLEMNSGLSCEGSTNDGRKLVPLLTEVIEDTRSLALELSSPELYELGLEPALEALVEHTESQFGMKAAFWSDRQKRELGEDEKILLFSATRELLMNVVKHAQAKSVRVSVESDRNKIIIQVSDDGIGFKHPPDVVHASRSGGFGLYSIKERLQSVGGELCIETSQEYGTLITMWIPVRIVAESESGSTHEHRDNAGG